MGVQGSLIQIRVYSTNLAAAGCGNRIGLVQYPTGWRVTSATVMNVWLGTMMVQFYAKGFRENIQHRFLYFSLFWPPAGDFRGHFGARHCPDGHSSGVLLAHHDGSRQHQQRRQ